VQVIVLCGFTASGKTTAAQYIASKKRSLQIVSVGDIIRQKMREQKLENNYENLQLFNESIIKNYGANYISITFDHIDCNSEIILIDSARTNNDLTCLRNFFGKIELVAITSDKETRFERLLNRSRATDPQNEKEFLDLIKKETLWGVPELIAKAEITILNEKRIEDFYAQITERLNL